MSRLPIAGLIFIAGCAAPPPAPDVQAPSAPTSGRGGYYLDDGPGPQVPADIGAIPDAQPRLEPLSRFANRPYEALGKRYVPLAAVQPFHERGLASWYGKRYHGRKTTSGEPYDMYAMTAAHPTLPIPSYARVTSTANGRSVVVRVNDRGPFLRGRVIDLSYAAAYRLGIVASGSGEVEVEAIVPDGAVRGEATLGKVFLQVGAFASRDNAESLRERLGSWVEAPGELLFAENLWRLQLGPYATSDEARAAAERLERAFDLKPLVVVR